MQDLPPSAPGPETPLPPGPSPGVSPNRSLMLVLAYLGILALVPLLVETDDAEVQWHAKNGLVLLAGWVVLGVGLAIFGSIPFVGWVLGCAVVPFWVLMILFVHVLAIVKALRGERLRVPLLSDFTDSWS